MFLVPFAILALFLLYLVWGIFEIKALIQTIFVLLISTVGEHYVSSQGYYQYSQSINNGPFLGRVPLWIPLMWLTIIQGTFIFSHLLSISGLPLCVATGVTAFVADILIIEPILSAKLGLWHWTPVENGYFSFVPPQINRFTAPFGNYFVWFSFVGLANFLLIGLVTVFP